jgi:hypothetical protein
MATFATPTELAAFMQQDVDTASATLVLDLVEAELVYASRVDAAADLPTWTKATGLAVAARVYANPVGLTSDAIDDYRRNFGGTFLTAQERTTLSGVSGDQGAFSITAYGVPYVAAAGVSTWPWDEIE